MWCWVSIEYDFLRVAAFYGPVWLVILTTLAIYVMVGKHIFQQSRPLHELQKETGQRSTWNGQRRLLHTQNPFLVQGITKTTDISITYESSSISSPSPRTPDTTYSNGEIRSAPLLSPSYSVTVEGGFPTAAPSSANMNCFGDGQILQKRKVIPASNKAAYSYCKCALLFFLAVFITWVPSSINRVYSLVYPTKVSFGLTLASSIVLPLQGFWNTLIYIITSLPACKALSRRLRRKLRGKTDDASSRSGSVKTSSCGTGPYGAGS